MAETTIIPFGYASPEDYKQACIACLMIQLSEYPPFVSDLEALKSYPLVLRRGLGAIRSMAKPEPRSIGDREEYDQAKGYVAKLDGIIRNYRLNPDWATETLHDAEGDINTLRHRVGFTYIDDYKTKTKKHQKDRKTRMRHIKWDMYSGRTKEEIRKNILEQFEKQWKMFERQAKKSGIFSIHARRALMKHVSWVCKAVCHQERKTWEQIAEEEQYDVDHIKKSAGAIMKPLGLKLRRGRPRK